MTEAYPYFEALEIGAAYIALLYIWPNAVFRRFLRGKGLAFRFMFCAMIQPILISSIVLPLALFGVLHAWILRAAFWGAFAASLLAPLRRGRLPAPRGYGAQEEIGRMAHHGIGFPDGTAAVVTGGAGFVGSRPGAWREGAWGP